MKFLIGASSEQGLRDLQQDRLCYRQINDKLICVVADGNGDKGEEVAEKAAKLVMSELCFVFSYEESNENLSIGEIKKLGISVINNAAEHVRILKNLNHEWLEAGSTITLLIITQDTIFCFWVGDSPAYLLEDGKDLTMLTSPVHTLAEELIQGGVPRESIKDQPSLHSVITKCIGHEKCEPDSKVFRVTKQSLVVVGSDGVFGFISEPELIEIMRNKSNQNIQMLVKEIVNTSLDNGSDDNVSALACFILPHSETKTIRNKRITKLCEWKC